MAKISVEYLGHFGSDLDVVNAARVSFSKESAILTVKDIELIYYLAEGLRKKERNVLIDELIGIGIEYNTGDIELSEASERARKLIRRVRNIATHWAPFTHCFAKFRMSVPIFVARQLHRSGVGFSPPLADEFAYSEESRRYIEGVPEFFEPDSWRARAEDVKQGSGGAHSEQAAAQIMLSAAHELATEDYGHLIANKYAPEQARMILPMSLMTNFIWTGSLYAYANLCKQRLDNHAQDETQEVAKLISAKMATLFPVSWKALVGID